MDGKTLIINFALHFPKEVTVNAKVVEDNGNFFVVCSVKLAFKTYFKRIPICEEDPDIDVIMRIAIRFIKEVSAKLIITTAGISYEKRGKIISFPNPCKDQTP